MAPCPNSLLYKTMAGIDVLYTFRVLIIFNCIMCPNTHIYCALLKQQTVLTFN